MTDGVVIEKEMGITHAEFFRNIGRVFDDFRQTAKGITVDGDGKSLTIDISQQAERRIALFVLPVTRVTLTFRGYGADEVTETIQRFDNAFRRGGG